MKKCFIAVLGLALLFAAGCRSVFEPMNPFTHGRWKYSDTYAPVEYDEAWEATLRCLVEKGEWKIETADKERGEIKTQWSRLQRYRLRAEIRLDRKKDDSGKEGVKFGLRVLRQRPATIWSPMRKDYSRWKWDDPDTRWESLLYMRLNQAFKGFVRKNSPPEPEPAAPKPVPGEDDKD